MKYNPTIHHRRSIRLEDYDYSQAGLYFITICCQDMVCRFGKIENGEMVLNDFGKIAYDEWVKLQERFPNMILDAFQVMPNHIHYIIALGNGTDTMVGATLAVALNVRAGASPAPTNTQNDGAGAKRAGASPAPTVGAIVGAYKSLVVNKCLEIYKMQNEYMGKFWQRNYWEHIIRNEKSYQYIANYIVNNPANWDKDQFYYQEHTDNIT
jgi:REP element-mobilizing transposase RayT